MRIKIKGLLSKDRRIVSQGIQENWNQETGINYFPNHVMMLLITPYQLAEKKEISPTARLSHLYVCCLMRSKFKKF